MFTDSPTKTDLLGRLPFAENIAKALIRFSEKNIAGIVTAITGKWGSGKSTLLTFVQDNLIAYKEKYNSNLEMVVFNPWMFVDTADMHAVFLNEIASKFKSIQEQQKNKRRKGKFLNLVKGLAGTNNYTKVVIPHIDKLLEQYKYNKTSKIKGDIDNALEKSKIKLFVFIDDFDRLYPKQVFELLQILKLACNFKNTYYVVAYDREAVETSIETQFKDYGKKFLDKIIQAEFLIPEPTSEQVESILKRELEQLLQGLGTAFDCKPLFVNWRLRMFINAFTTLRDVYRYLNSLQFSLPGILEEVNMIDFLLIELVRLNDFQSYQKIYNDYTIAHRVHGNLSNIISKEYPASFDRPITNSIVEYLLVDKGILNYTNDSGEGRRLKDPAYFMRYFTLQLNSSDVTEQEILAIIANPAASHNLLVTILNAGRIDEFAKALLRDDRYKEYENVDFSLVTTLFFFFNSTIGKYEYDNHKFADLILCFICLEYDNRAKLFGEFIQMMMQMRTNVNDGVIYYFHYMLLASETPSRYSRSWSEFRDYYITKIDEIRAFYIEYLRNVVVRCTDFGKLESNRLISKIKIMDYATYLPEIYARDFEEKFASNKEGALFLLYCVVSIDASDNKPFDIEQKKMEVFLPDELKAIFLQKLAALNHNDLSRNEGELVRYFLGRVKL